MTIPTNTQIQSAMLWESYQTMNRDFTCEQGYQPNQGSVTFDAISQVLGIIECAEEQMITSCDLFNVDLEPTPIGPNGVETTVSFGNPTLSLSRQENFFPSLLDLRSQPMSADNDRILENYISSMKQRTDLCDSDNDEYHPLTKKQKLSTPPEIVQSSASVVLTTSNTMVVIQEDVQPARFRRYQADQWMERFEDLVAFKSENGHCLVPHSFPPNQQLAQWVKRQRYQHKLKMLGRHSTLTDERQQELEQMGFVWDSHRAAWDERLEDLKKYRSTFGNCLVPTNYDENRSLAVWVKCQRRQYRRFRLGQQSTMTQERFEELDRLGFDWNPRNL